MKNALIYFFIANFLLMFNGGFTAPSKYEGMIIRMIEFEGLKNVDAEDLLVELEQTYIDKGFPLKASEVRKAIKLIFAKGQFEDVTAEVAEHGDGVKLRFVCRERPLISKITFKGLKEKSNIDLEGIIPVKEGDVLKVDLLENSINLMKNKYKEDGFYSAVINYKLNKNEKENTVEVYFIVDEGEEIKVEKISILGSRKVKADKLRSVMETKESGWLDDGKFNKDIYEQDKGKIIAYLKELGYNDAQIIEDRVEYEWKDPEEEKDRAIYITIKVVEGEKYYFDKYTISGNKIFDTKTLESKFQLTKTGEEFNNTSFQMDRQSISFTYASKGYIFARVTPKRTVEEREVKVKEGTEKRKFVRIDFEIQEGSQAYIENIIIKGNKKTKDKVIRREIAAKEGELFNSAKIQISREKVFNLGYFKQVNFDIRPGSKEGLMNLIVDVEEQPSGTISLGGGYGTQSGFSIFGDIAENNLMGNGQRVGLRLQYGPTQTEITLSFHEPWLMDNYPLGFSSSIFYKLYTIKTDSMFSSSSDDDEAEYQLQKIGYTLGLHYQFWYHYTVGAIWGHAFKTILNASGNCDDDIFLEQSYERQETRTISYYISRNTKDNYLNPTRGTYAKFRVDLTGGTVLRGDDHFITYTPETYAYFNPFGIHLPFLKTHPIVIELRANGTFNTPPFDKRRLEKIQSQDDNAWLESEDMLYLGGAETLRGWDAYDDLFPESWQNRLYHRITYGAELRIPVHPQMFWLALFFDAGSLWTDSFWEKTASASDRRDINNDRANKQLYDIRDFFNADKMSYFKYSWGFGFKVQIPMMPLRFWFGRKVEWVGMDKGFFHELSQDFNFQFSIGDFRF
ncbi:MAG: outer membrane protein assembly factor BamA [Spirochaetes bacterium]|nr:outer membrane protein assembly factor BamA [Spirochaetota bacterium]